MDTARHEVVSRATRLAGKTHCTRCTPRPEGAFQVTWHRVAALEKGMPEPAPRAKRVLWVFSTGCAGMPHHLFQVTWGALNPSILGGSATVYMSTFDAGIGQIRGELNSYTAITVTVTNGALFERLAFMRQPGLPPGLNQFWIIFCPTTGKVIIELIPG